MPRLASVRNWLVVKAMPEMISFSAAVRERSSVVELFVVREGASLLRLRRTLVVDDDWETEGRTMSTGEALAVLWADNSFTFGLAGGVFSDGNAFLSIWDASGLVRFCSLA